jgi:sRNA-binding carbon storage regulator CsrA
MRAFANKISWQSGGSKQDLKCVKVRSIINEESFKISIDAAEKLCIMRTSLTQSVSEKLKRKQVFDTAL